MKFFVLSVLYSRTNWPSKSANFWVAKALMSSFVLCKNIGFKKPHSAQSKCAGSQPFGCLQRNICHLLHTCQTCIQDEVASAAYYYSQLAYYSKTLILTGLHITQKSIQYFAAKFLGTLHLSNPFQYSKLIFL